MTRTQFLYAATFGRARDRFTSATTIVLNIIGILALGGVVVAVPVAQVPWPVAALAAVVILCVWVLEGAILMLGNQQEKHAIATARRAEEVAGLERRLVAATDENTSFRRAMPEQQRPTRSVVAFDGVIGGTVHNVRGRGFDSILSATNSRDITGTQLLGDTSND